ncbi:hypothetical protein [Pseudozobellia sp. WGM2]|uniref:hypothetical protein n=1 Tax=Pseudozobellia sp. WGM2 TaxID=2787625 RepID=UPI001AE0B425|nr:hypothetical protein [Pseudozobellia sp. WGM2]
MKTQTRRAVALLFLAFTISMELVCLHVFTHDESKSVDDCNICYVLQTGNHSPMLPQYASEFSLPEFSFVFQHRIIRCEDVPVLDRLFSYNQFSRPPPII